MDITCSLLPYLYYPSIVLLFPSYRASTNYVSTRNKQYKNWKEIKEYFCHYSLAVMLRWNDSFAFSYICDEIVTTLISCIMITWEHDHVISIFPRMCGIPDCKLCILRWGLFFSCVMGLLHIFGSDCLNYVYKVGMLAFSLVAYASLSFAMERYIGGSFLGKELTWLFFAFSGYG